MVWLNDLPTIQQDSMSPKGSVCLESFVDSALTQKLDIHCLSILPTVCTQMKPMLGAIPSLSLWKMGSCGQKICCSALQFHYQIHNLWLENRCSVSMHPEKEVTDRMDTVLCNS